MNIDKHCSHILQSNTYLLTEKTHSLLIDPTQCSLKWVTYGMELDYILLTHEHYDHINGVNELKAAFPSCRVVCSAACAERICDPRLNSSHYFEALCRMQTRNQEARSAKAEPYACEADMTFQREMPLAWQGHSLRLRELRGHSPGSICILIDDCLLFTGDTLLRDEPTITRFPGGSLEELRSNAYPFLKNLPDGIKILPGHGDAFFLGEIADLWNHMNLEVMYNGKS